MSEGRVSEVTPSCSLVSVYGRHVPCFCFTFFLSFLKYILAYSLLTTQSLIYLNILLEKGSKLFEWFHFLHKLQVIRLDKKTSLSPD